MQEKKLNKALIINTHHPYESSKGKLNGAIALRIKESLEAKGWEARTTRTSERYEVAAEAEKHVWADLVVVQGPVNWMGFPWSYKKYQDEVYGALGGKLFDGDGRHRSDPSLHYGSGGLGQGKKYMLSLTFNAPRTAFGDTEQYLFQGKDVDDLFFPAHMCFRFMGMVPVETFVCYDVHKDPNIENDFRRLGEHLDRNF